MLHRPRRLRAHPLMRELVAQTNIEPRHLMMPHFILPGDNKQVDIEALPGISKITVERLVEQVGADLHLGIDKVLLFGVPEEADKDAWGGAAAAEDGPVLNAVRMLKQTFGERLLVTTDVCLCAYTDHGHCGVLSDVPLPGGSVDVDNDATLPLLAQVALMHAEAGADMVAPSDMMDGRVGAIRNKLDAAGLYQTAIMSYAVKYASAYYGPFREAANSAPSFGDRKSYQMDPRNRDEALREIALDTQEGADWLMVKPAMAYLDVIARVKQNTQLPVACYNVSGEYAMVKAASERGFIDERSIVMENLLAMRRAGADLIISYHARDVLSAGWL
jgi:porphobilinogen synthase